MNKKGQGTFLWVALSVVAILSVFAILASTNVITLSAAPIAIDGDFDGEFDEFALPDDVTGTALIANTTYAEASEAFTVAYESYVNVNGTAGVTYQFAARMETSGDMENFDADLALGDALVTEMEFTKFYILLDEEGVSLNEDNALYVGDVDSDKDEAELKIDAILDGDYVIVVEARTLPAVSAFLSGESMFTIAFDADSDDSDAVDEGTLTAYNYI